MQYLLNASLAIYSQIRDDLRQLITAFNSVDARYAAYAGAQLHYYSERCQSLNILLQEWKLWDSDIVMRSALECASRFLFVSIAPNDERAQRIVEYTVSLNEIEELQRSERARSAVEAAVDEDTHMLIGGVVLDPTREEELRAKWPKVARNALRQRWSFSEIARTLTNFHDDGLDLRKYKSLLHSYGVSSHLIHADQTAMDIVRDRMGRQPEERRLMERAHFARLATEQTFLLFLCWRAAVYATGLDSRNEGIGRGLMELTAAADRHHEEFARSQSHRYE